MDELDNKIKNILSKNISTSNKYKYIIRNTLKEKNSQKTFNKYFKIVSTTCACLVLSTSLVFATSYITYKKIWKEPQITNNTQEEKVISQEITDEEKGKFISKTSAKEIAENILDKLGFENEQIRSIELLRGYNSQNSIYFTIKTENAILNINPNNGKLDYFVNNSILNQNIVCDKISKEQAENIALQIYKKLNIFDENDNYDIVEAKKQNITFGQKILETWQVSFAKKYNNQYDKTNLSTVSFLQNNGNVLIYTISGKRENDFENNPIIISKEEAIGIAKNKEETFSDLKIDDISAELSIEKMNIFIYCLENNTKNENGELSVDDITRNVWVVNIKHKKDFIPKDGELDTVKKFYNKKYFVDATTGEIIGGDQSEFFN